MLAFRNIAQRSEGIISIKKHDTNTFDPLQDGAMKLLFNVGLLHGFVRLLHLGEDVAVSMKSTQSPKFSDNSMQTHGLLWCLLGSIGPPLLWLQGKLFLLLSQHIMMAKGTEGNRRIFTHWCFLDPALAGDTEVIPLNVEFCLGWCLIIQELRTKYVSFTVAVNANINSTMSTTLVFGTATHVLGGTDKYIIILVSIRRCYTTFLGQLVRHFDCHNAGIFVVGKTLAFGLPD
jgi:hypothetical protein